MSDFLEDNGALFVEVILPLPIKKLFTYRLPSEYFEFAMVGKRVFVPFGVKKVYTAIIYNITSEPPSNYEALNVISMIDDNPILDQNQLKFWKWIASYYMCGLGDVMLAALPNGLRIASESFVCLQTETEYIEEDLDPREILIINALKGKEKVKISDLETQLKSKASFVKIIKSLYDRDLIILFEDIGQQFKAKQETFVKINSNSTENDLKSALQSLETKSKNQYDILLSLLAQPKQTAVKKDLINKYLLKTSSFKSLVDKNLIEEYKVDTSRFSFSAQKPFESMILSEAQNHALVEIETEFKQKNVVLLHGVTSSGKTNIYIELIKKQIENNHSVLILVPEIALTEQFINTLQEFFGSVMMIAHSRFTFNEKVEIWNSVKNGTTKVLIGSRSSIFMPFKNLGLIIIDEEHENTFKQSEKSPRYHARDASLVLANMCGAKVLLGSATPSVESYYNAKHQKYGLVTLNQRFGETTKAEIIIVDTKEEERTKKMTSVFSETLFNKLKHLRQEKSQAILFQNRKGFFPILECSTCGWVSKCINCDISMTYYKYSNNLRCHYCGFHQDNISKCQACGNHSMTMQGYGTERITEELQLLLPELNIQRFDQDSTKKKNAFKTIIKDFEEQKIDVLVGTQIVVKGFDFKNVQLAAVVNADQLLNFPDFRANERTFQLLIQLAGRAGRHGKKGEMIIQTKQADHPVLQAIKNYDFSFIYDKQLTERQLFLYPPFGKIIRITFKHKTQEVVNEISAIYANVLKKQLGGMVLGPEVPHVSKIRNYYIRNILIKASLDHGKYQKLKEYLEEVYDYIVQKGQFKSVVFIADVDAL